MLGPIAFILLSQASTESKLPPDQMPEFAFLKKMKIQDKPLKGYAGSTRTGPDGKEVRLRHTVWSYTLVLDDWEVAAKLRMKLRKSDGWTLTNPYRDHPSTIFAVHRHDGIEDWNISTKGFTSKQTGLFIFNKATYSSRHYTQ